MSAPAATSLQHRDGGGGGGEGQTHYLIRGARRHLATPPPATPEITAGAGEECLLQFCNGPSPTLRAQLRPSLSTAAQQM